MYRFNILDNFPAPPEITFAAATRDLDSLLEEIPQLTELRTLQRLYLQPHSERIALALEARVPVPGLLRHIVQPEWFRWREELLCHQEPPTIIWAVHSTAFSKQVHCHGQTRFQGGANGTQARSQGLLELQLEQLPGVPSNLMASCNACLEELLGRLITPNVQAYFAAVRRRL